MKKITLLSILTLIVTGCATPQKEAQMNKNRTHTVDGKQFSIPEGMIPSPHIATKKEVDFFKKSGVKNCHYGDILWEALSAQRRIDEAIKTGNPDIHKTLAKEGKIGCASPLN